MNDRAAEEEERQQAIDTYVQGNEPKITWESVQKGIDLS
jgi:hypothetical protein